jgi:hypothetical protein
MLYKNRVQSTLSLCLIKAMPNNFGFSSMPFDFLWFFKVVVEV